MIPIPMTGVVLAAGRSERMGRPKALLACPPGDETFVARVVRSMREAGLRDVAVVGRQTDDALRTCVLALPDAPAFVVNPDPARGQLSSLIAGVDHADRRGAAAVLVMPVDIPLVRAATLAQVVAVWRASGLAIARAVHQGRHGHPVIFSRATFDALRGADPLAGARSVLAAQPEAVVDVEVDDPAVLRDVDHPDDYRRLFGREP